MITARDLEYNNPSDASHNWAETYFLPVSVPEGGIFAQIYVVVRPVFGVMTNDIVVYDKLSDDVFDMVYLDTYQQLPAPNRFSDINSPSGLAIRAVRPPRDFRIDYVGYDDTEIHVDWIGLMDPFDIHDPRHSPNAGATEIERLANTSMGTAYRGHFDMTGAVKGTLRVRGQEFNVDCMDRMDHSWGERDEMRVPSMNSITVNFDKDIGFRLLFRFEQSKPLETAPTFSHGYVYRNGEARGVVSAKLRIKRAGKILVGMVMALEDVDGEKYELNATANVGAPWHAYAGSMCWNSMMRWTMGDRIGHGVVMENRSFHDSWWKK